MLKFLLIALCTLIAGAKSVFAFIPTYADDEEYYQCVRATNDYNNCAVEQMRRNLNMVKKQYKVIITNPNIIGWHKDISENTNTLRDMYESWTAFRTRICSLSDKAARYLEPLIDEKISCNSFYVSHHKSHLGSIILLLSKNVPADRNKFDYLDIYEHDTEYDECMKGKNTSKCLKDELARSTKQIKNLYKTLSEDNFVGKWNNGPDLKNGNYRDMYDSWIAYRNRMCALSVWAYKVGYGDKGADITQCMQFFNRENLESLQNILLNANSTIDENHDGNFKDDGGESEGKTIKPLDRRFDAEQNEDDVLESEERKEISADATSENKRNMSKKNIPTWAK